MTYSKQVNKSMAMRYAVMVSSCYSRSCKRKMAGRCLEHLRASLRQGVTN